MKLTRDKIEYVTKEAHAFHMQMLTRYGNHPQEDQRHTLKALVQMFSEMAAGVTTGRYPWPISTGAGKTTAIIAWIVTLERLGIDEGASPAIAASMIEALCRMKRELVAYGVPAEKIGLLHSKKYDASKPETKGQRRGLQPRRKVGRDRQPRRGFWTRHGPNLGGRHRP